MSREEPRVLFENEKVLVINKPVGWVVNEAESVKEETIAAWLIREGLVKVSGESDNELFEDQELLIDWIKKLVDVYLWEKVP